MNLITKLILNNLKIAYALTDPHLKILEVNDPLNLLGKNYCLGCSLFDVAPELNEDKESLNKILAGQLAQLELTQVNRETSSAPLCLMMEVLPYQEPNGQISGLLLLIQNVTEWQQAMSNDYELRLLQDKLARQNLDLAAANIELRRVTKMKSIFVSIAAHEMRTPLSRLKGSLEMLLDESMGTLEFQQIEIAEMAQQSAQRLLTITEDLLDVTRIDTGQIELILYPTHLPTFMEAVITQFNPVLQAKGQHLNFHYTPDLPFALIDESRTVQIMNNLLSNANKYTSTGGTITVEVTRFAQDSAFLQVSIMDTGIGISPENQVDLFGRFLQASNNDQSGATGVGLYITHGLVELHGGDIWVESKLRHGTTFYMTFLTTESRG